MEDESMVEVNFKPCLLGLLKVFRWSDWLKIESLVINGMT